MTESRILAQARALIPRLANTAHKGQAGKIAVIGGCKEYTGAPYYSAISSLKVGCDLAHIFCTEEAGTPIKSYSPEIIVHPTLKENSSSADASANAQLPKSDPKVVHSVTSWFQAIHSLVVGPGLGRDTLLWATAIEILNEAKKKELPLIIDGDGLNLVCSNPALIHGYKYAVLTPNVVEFKRLCKAVFPDADQEKEIEVAELAKKMGNVTIIQKGLHDKISDGKSGFECDHQGSPRRCGGQGDMLTGCISTFVAWAVEWSKNGEGKGKTHEIPPVVAACYAACTLSRHAGALAFKKHKRSSTTPDMIQELGSAFDELFPDTI